MDKIRLYSFCRHNSIDLDKLDEVKDFTLKLLIKLTKTYVGEDILDGEWICERHFIDNWAELELELKKEVGWIDNNGKDYIFKSLYQTFYSSSFEFNEIELRFKRGEQILKHLFTKENYYTDVLLNELLKIYKKCFK